MVRTQWNSDICRWLALWHSGGASCCSLPFSGGLLYYLPTEGGGGRGGGGRGADSPKKMNWAGSKMITHTKREREIKKRQREKMRLVSLSLCCCRHPTTLISERPSVQSATC